MTNPAVLLLCLCAFALLASLPFTFFRRGRPTVGWWMTAAPFFADAALLLAALTGSVEALALPAHHARALSLAAVPLAAAAIALTAYTIGVHRAPVSLWHQAADTPAHLVTVGPYARVRHPFYASFILMLTAAAAALPHPGTLALLGIGSLQLHRTARREEKRLLASPLAAEYAAYMVRTGRFVPRYVRRAPPDRDPSGSTCSTTRASSPVAIRQSVHPLSAVERTIPFSMTRSGQPSDVRDSMIPGARER